MTITYHDRFAWKPTRCNKCNRLFIFEFYDNYYKSVGLFSESVKLNECKKCREVQNNDKKNI